LQCWGTVVNSWRDWLRLASQGGLGVLDKSGNDLRSLWANLARGRGERGGKIGRFAPDDFAIDFDAIELDDQQERVGGLMEQSMRSRAPVSEMSRTKQGMVEWRSL
jgi:3-oxoacyl-(acyl-carrier-protein) synthase